MVRYGGGDTGLKAKESVNENHWFEKPPKRGFLASKFVEFCNRTDLHGYKYIVMEDINMPERSLWALAVVLSVGVAAYFVVTAYRWYARNPIVTVIESTHGPVWDVPFPAVTICDLNTISRRAAKEFAANVTLPPNITPENVFEYLRWAPLLHSSFQANETQKWMLSKLQDVLDLNKITTETLFASMSPVSSCGQLVQRCMWKNTVYRCEMLFQQVFTQLNLCCAFNYFAVNVSLNTLHATNELGKQVAPRRVASCGYQTALTVLINTAPDDYYSSAVASQGALVLIDDSYNLPDLDSQARMVNPSTEVLISLSPERTYATPGIKSFIPEQRQCYYNDERQISQFRHYSYHNCMAFKKVQYIKKTCDCLPFYFPTTDDHRKCNFKDLDCLEKIGSTNESEPEPDDVMQCLPECEHYDYPLEVALGMLAKQSKLNGIAFFNDVNLDNRSLLNVFFNDLVSTRYRRDVYLNWQNILASFGGLLSLMLGFTLISGFDLIIFFTFRIAYDALKTISSNESQKQDYTSKRGEPSFATKELYVGKPLEWETERRYGNVKY
ncbi:sodium channel protein Nach-like [Cydia fagiglandana]|uniref:sodium channel protein Nach-like n=1 Tax=Cydia fagiglandana TaxID=1458189 RepID=UPI002FEE3204